MGRPLLLFSGSIASLCPAAAGKSGEEAKRNEVEAAALQRIMAALEQNKPARSVELSEEEAELGKALLQNIRESVLNGWLLTTRQRGARRRQSWASPLCTAPCDGGDASTCSMHAACMLAQCRLRPWHRRLPPNLLTTRPVCLPSYCVAVKGLCLLTSKPMVYAANVAEDDLAAPEENKYVQVSGTSNPPSCATLGSAGQPHPQWSALPPACWGQPCCTGICLRVAWVGLWLLDGAAVAEALS